jgi:hypothetical protein
VGLNGCGAGHLGGGGRADPAFDAVSGGEGKSVRVRITLDRLVSGLVFVSSEHDRVVRLCMFSARGVHVHFGAGL